MASRTGDWPYKLEMFPLDKLYVDKAYQRPVAAQTYWKEERPSA